MPAIPSLPFLPNASLPEVLWVVSSLIGLWVTLRARSRSACGRDRLKNTVRSVAVAVFLGAGLVALTSPPSPAPTWLSVLIPMAMAFGAFSMALLGVIDEQAAAP